ncbi:MAG TPA: IS4 family transposase [Candidatus Rifleibacterium sp.]|nr:IS4 family transposase [Candidatus Rifleibacterium sp.]
MSIIEHSALYSRKIGSDCQLSALYFFREHCFLNVTQFRRCAMPRLKTYSDPTKQAFYRGLEKLTSELSEEKINEIATRTGFVERCRKVVPAIFLWNLVMGFGVSLKNNLAMIRRRYKQVSDIELAPASFFDRFNDRLVAFLREVLQELIQSLSSSSLPRNILKTFKDVCIFDSTILKLQDGLAKLYPGTKMAAGAKISVVMSVACESVKNVTIHAGSKAEIKTIELGDWVRDHLLLFDMGFFKGSLFHKIMKWGGHFITRLKSNMNPVITRNNLASRGRAIDVEGKKLKDVLGQIKRSVLDVNIALPCNFRKYAGVARKTEIEVRLVGILNEESREYHLYITDLPSEQFPAEAIAQLYRGRWAIELMFKELKTNYSLETVMSSKPEVIQALIYSAMITLVISRKLFIAYRDAMALKKKVVSRQAWAIFLTENSKDILRMILKAGKIECSERELFLLAMSETLDKSLKRKKLDDVWNI